MAAEVVREMAERGCASVVLTTDVGDARHRAGALGPEDPPGVRVLRLRNLSNALAFRNLFLPAATARIDPFDVVHLYGHRHLLAPVAVYLARRRDAPLFLSTQGTAPRLEARFFAKRVYDALLGDRILRGADGLIAAARIETRDFEVARVPRERVFVIPNAIPVEAFDHLPPRGLFRKRTGVGDRPIVLFVGSITERKGIHHLARAMGSVTPPEAVLVAAGLDFGFGETVRAASREAGSLGRILYPGHLSDAERLEAYADADLFVLPSEREVFGLAAFEALLCELPVITTEGTGCAEVLERTGGGWIVPQGDPARLAAAISHALTHPAEGRARAARGSRVVREEMTLRAHVDRLIEAYRLRLDERAAAAFRRETPQARLHG